MGDSKNIIILVLVVAVIALAAWAFYFLPQKAEKECTIGCQNKIETEVIPQLSVAAEQECMTQISTCQQAVNQLMQVPECAAALEQ